MRIMSTLLLLALLPIQTVAAEYYLANFGHDSYDGSKEKPWKTLHRLDQQSLQPGDAVYLAGGHAFYGTLYLDEQSCSADSKNPIIIAAWGKGRAKIFAGDSSAVLVRNLSGIIIRDIEVIGRDRMANRGSGIRIINDKPGNPQLKHIRIHNVVAHGFKWAGIFVGGIPTDDPGFEAPEGCRFGFRDVLIDSCSAYDNVYYGIHVTAHWKAYDNQYGNANVVIRDCYAYDNPGDPTYTQNHSGSGIMLDDCENGIIEYCVAFRNGALNAGQTGGPIGIWAHASTNIKIQYCESFSNRTGGAADGGGFDFDGGVTNSTMLYCYSHDNDGAGYLMWNWHGAPFRLGDNIIRYCISENDCRRHQYGAVHLGGAPISNITVHNNVFVTRAAESASPSGVLVALGAHKNIRFFNNVFLVDENVPLVDFKDDQAEAYFSHNVFWSLSLQPLFYRADEHYARPEEWTALNQQMEKNLMINPLIVTTYTNETIGYPHHLSSLHNFRLLPHSPLFEAGLAFDDMRVPALGFDFYGNPLPKKGPLSIGVQQTVK